MNCGYTQDFIRHVFINIFKFLDKFLKGNLITLSILVVEKLATPYNLAV